MGHETKEIGFLSWDRLRTRGLVVEPDLLGLFHEFNHDDSLVRVELPSSDDLDNDERYDQRLRIQSCRMVDGNKVPTAIAVISVDVTVFKNQTVQIPIQALAPPISHELFSKEEQKRLDGIAESYSVIARSAFGLWLRTLHWICGKGFIGRSEIRNPETGWGTYLLNADTKTRFWANSSPVKLYVYSPVTLADWKSMGRSLQNGETPPIYCNLLSDAEEYFRNGDYVRTVVDAAVACETYLRTLVNQELPKELDTTFKKYIDDANIRQVLKYFVDRILSEVGKKRLSKMRSRLHELFDARNDLLHSGYVRNLTEEECKRFLETTRSLITLKNAAQDTQMESKKREGDGQEDT